MQRITHITLSLLFLLSTALQTACTGETDSRPESLVVRSVKTIEVQSTSNNQKRVLSGYVQAERFAELSFQVGGQVVSVNVAPGDKVTEGTVLAQIDQQPFELRVTTAKAELDRAKADLKEQHEHFLSQKRVYDKNYISKSVFESAAAEHTKAQSAVKLADSRLALAQRDLDNSTMRAPFDGVITKRILEPFQMISASMLVFEIQDESDLEVVVLLPGSLVESVDIGDAVNVDIPTVNLKNLSATVTERSIKADAKGSFPIVATLVGTTPGVLAGMPAKLTISRETALQNIILPNTAVAVDESGSSYVFVYEPESSTVNKLAIESERYGSDEFLISGGLNDGQQVVVAGAEFLRDDMRVSVYSVPDTDAIPARKDDR